MTDQKRSVSSLFSEWPSSTCPQQVQINHTCNVARLCGLEAAKRGVKAYVRLQQPWYICSDRGSRTEKENLRPLGTMGTWWHETLRVLGAIEGFVYSHSQPVAILTGSLKG